MDICALKSVKNHRMLVMTHPNFLSPNFSTILCRTSNYFAKSNAKNPSGVFYK